MNNKSGRPAANHNDPTPTPEQQRDILANAIRDAALKRGIVREDAALTGPHLLMLCEDLGQVSDPGAKLIRAAQNVEAWITDYVPEGTTGREVEFRELRAALEPFNRVDGAPEPAVN